MKNNNNLIFKTDDKAVTRVYMYDKSFWSLREPYKLIGKIYTHEGTLIYRSLQISGFFFVRIPLYDSREMLQIFSFMRSLENE